MFCFRLVCDCGYQSEDVCWGERPWSGHQSMTVPIYDPDTGKLSSHEFSVAEWTEAGDNLESWFRKYSVAVRDLYGKQASPLIPAEYDTPFMVCPKCGRRECKAISTGIA